MARRRELRALGEPLTQNRRVIKIGSSYYLNLPPEFVRECLIESGQKIPVIYDCILRVIPPLKRQGESYAPAKR